MRSFGILLAVAPLTFVSFCEGGPVRFTVENQTYEDMYVSAFYERCQELPGNKQDYYLNEQAVPPLQTLRISKDSPGAAHDVKCVLAMDHRRRLVLSEPYDGGATYVVSEATPIQQVALPPFDELPSQSWLDRQREDFDEDPAGYVVSVVVIAGFLTAVVAGAIVATVYGILYSVRQRKSRQESGDA